MLTRIHFLDRAEKDAIHKSSLELLETVGVEIGSNEARDMLAKKGAKVIGDNVRFPVEMVNEALTLVNKQIALAARDSKKSISIPAPEPFATTIGYVSFINDEGADEKRASTSDDLRKFAILSDALDEFGFFWPAVFPTEVPENFQEYYALEVALKNTTKHVQASVSSGKVAKWQIELASLIAGGKDNLRKAPIISLLGAPTTPLAIEKGIAESIVVCAQHGIPIVPMSLPQMGSSSPATVASNTLMANVEELACYLIAKCADEGAPVIYSTDTGAPNLRTYAMNYNNPEYFILSTGNADMARYYGMPSMVASGMTEYKDFTTLAGFERNVLKVAMNMMTRTDLSCWFGSVDNSISASLVEVILDAEVYRQAKVYLRSFSADEYHLAVDVIKEVGPRGNFLSHPHTYRNFKREIVTEQLKDTFIYSNAPKNYRQLAEEKLNYILSNHKVTPLDESLNSEIDKISKRAYADLISKI